MEKTINIYKTNLSKFIAFKSVSTNPKFASEIKKTSDWLSGLLKKNGFTTDLWEDPECNPVVYAKYMISNSAETILIYGHYDVQPASKNDGWKYEPFILGEDKNRFYGRGVIDNKGQVLVHIANILNLIATKKLKYNVKFLIEGNEETGNGALRKIMKKKKSDLKCDFVLISDGELTNNKPTIEVSLRGGFNATLIYKTAKNNLHSGMWGGAVPNASHELSFLISKFYDKNNNVSFPDFYTGTDQITKDELKNNRKLSEDTKEIVKLAGVKKMLIEKGLDFYTATGLRPTIQVTGFKSGYTESGYSNIIPAVAEVRINFRTSPTQKTGAVMKSFSDFVKANTPDFVDYQIIFDQDYEGIKITTENKYVGKIINILKTVYRKDVNLRNVGGSIPFVTDVKTILGVDTVSVPLVNEDCNMHGTDENFSKKYLIKALEFSRKLFSI